MCLCLISDQVGSQIRKSGLRRNMYTRIALKYGWDNQIYASRIYMFRLNLRTDHCHCTGFAVQVSDPNISSGEKRESNSQQI